MIYTLPFIAAIIGWFTNYIAVKMLFHPRKRTRILFFHVQGIFPKRQKAIAEKLGSIVSNELFSLDDISQALKGQQNLQSITDIVGEKLDDFLNNKLGSKMPMLAMFLNDSTKATIKNTLLDEFQEMLPEVVDGFVESSKKNIDIEKTVYDKVVDFSTDKLEQILNSILKKEFKFIEILGGVLGFIIGCVQMLLVLI